MNHNSLGCKQPSDLDVNQLPSAQDISQPTYVCTYAPVLVYVEFLEAAYNSLYGVLNHQCLHTRVLHCYLHLCQCPAGDLVHQLLAFWAVEDEALV